MSHPPFCPGTEEEFQESSSGGVGLDLHEECLDSFWDRDKRIIARYQACAWMDRADRWEMVARKRLAGSLGAIHKCMRNARAWREWENDV